MFGFHKRQKGQAAAEYVVLIPASIMIAISAAMIVGFINNSLGRTVDGLNRTGICETQDADNNDEGPTFAQVGPHQIRLTSNVYNPATNQTTVTYTVSSMADPSISHWMLGLPQSVYSSIRSVTNESQYEYVTDPTTGVTGMKFDTGYESAGGGGNGGGGNGGNGGNGGRGGGRSSLNDSVVMTSFRLTVDADAIDAVSRDITLLVTGQYTFESSQISIKAGTNTYYGTISTPVTVYDPSQDTEANCDE